MMAKYIFATCFVFLACPAFAEYFGPVSNLPVANGGTSGLSFAVAQNGLGSPSGTMSGYAIGDTITLACSGVTFSRAPVIGVAQVSSGTVTGSGLNDPGLVTGSLPSVNASCAQASTSGAGTGYAVSVTFGIVAAYVNPAALSNGGGPYNGSFVLNYGDTQSWTGSGAENTYFGDKAGYGFVGFSAFNTAMGHNACGNGGTGATAPSNFNTCIGNDAGRNMQGSGVQANMLLGTGAGRNISGSGDTFIGFQAGGSNGANSAGAVTSVNATAVGYQAGESLTNGSWSIFIGALSGYSVNGQNDVMIGPASGNNGNTLNASTAYNSTYVGANTGTSVTSGSGNVFIGSATGQSITTGSNNVIVQATNGGDSCSNGNESNVVAVCAGAGRVLTVTGAGTPGTSATKIAGTLNTGAFTVSALPSSPGAGARAYVTDASSCATRLGSVTGGGSTFCPVIYNGSAWVQN